MTKAKENYLELLKNPKWIEKRNKILSRDKNTCQYCGATDRYLQVHHKRYINGRKPWEYDDKDLITLCSCCHHNITDDNNNLYGNFIEARNKMREFGFSDSVLSGLLCFVVNSFDTINDHVIPFGFEELKLLLCSSVGGTQNFDDVKVAARLGINMRPLIENVYPQFIEEYDRIVREERIKFEEIK